MNPTNTPATKKRKNSTFGFIDIHEELTNQMKAIDSLGNMIGNNDFIDPDFRLGLFFLIDNWLDKQKKLLNEMLREIKSST
jgi:putative hemolysin